MSNELPSLSFDLSAVMGLAKKHSKTSFLTIPKDGQVFAKILPAYGASSNGAIATKHVLHWGFLNENGVQSPVKCSYHGPERYCPICEHVFSLKKELKQYVDDDGNVIGGSKERIDSLKETISALGARTGYLLNAVDYADGQVKVLQIPSTAFDGLVEKLEESVNKYKFDPLSLDKGVWFKFSRSGKGFNTKYAVDFKKIIKKTSDGEDAEVRDVSSLDKETVEVIKKQLSGGEGPMRDLGAMYDPKTAKELKAILDGAPVTHKKTSTKETVSKYVSNDNVISELEPEEEFSMPIAPSSEPENSNGVRSQIEELRRKARASRDNV